MIRERERQQDVEEKDLGLTRLRDRVRVRKAMGFLAMISMATATIAFCVVVGSTLFVLVVSLAKNHVQDAWLLRYDSSTHGSIYAALGGALRRVVTLTLSGLG